MRVALVAGPGGSGVTTMAALTAVAAAGRGRRTVLVSADPSVQEILGSGEPRPGLTLVRPDAVAAAASGWPAIAGYLAKIGVDDELDPADLAAVPGAAGAATLLAVAAVAASGQYQDLVVDAGSSAVDLLAIPETTGRLIDLTAPVPMRILRQFNGLFDARSRTQADSAAAPDMIAGLLDRLLLARTVLTESVGAAVHLVSGPRPLRRAAARRLVPVLAAHGAGLGRVLNNGVTGDPADPDTGWPAESLTVPAQAAEPTGDRLDALSRSVFGERDPLELEPGPAFVDPVVMIGTDGEYRLEIPLPLADRDALDLARAGGDLLLTVNGRTRRTELPSVLQRCRVTGAAFSEEQLTVSFVPDPARWPQAVPQTASRATGAAGNGGPDE